MNEINELQQRRAVNLVWNGARNHSFEPDFKVYDSSGEASIYWNIIIGAVRRHYEYDKLAKIFHSFDQYEDGDIYEGLFWLGLENSTYQKELADRPILKSLRESYAESYLREYTAPLDDYRLYDCLSTAHYMRVLGIEPKLSKYDIKLLDELEFSPDMTTDEIVLRAEELFQRWFQISTKERKERKRMFQMPLKKKAGRAEGKRLRKFGLGSFDFQDKINGSYILSAGWLDNEIRTKMTDSELRQFMTEKYGKPLFDPVKAANVEKQLCRLSHENCHLHFTTGEPVPGKIQNAFEALHKRQEKEQIEQNRSSYKANLVQNRLATSRLAEKIRNAALLYLEPADIKSNSGKINCSTVWRAAKLNEENVFTRREREDIGEISVDILLDASTSQKSRQELVSAQGYIIAEALSRCHIPCRVMSFCSMTGYTIMRVFRDYLKPRDNERIFEYVSNGCNRDGLAIKAAHYLIDQTGYEHKMLIVLSDVKPNDIMKIRTAPDSEPQPYIESAGITDTALEVRRAQEAGIAVMCVFTGGDDDLPAAKLVYGRSFARIQSLDKLADAVGQLIQTQIRNL